MLNRFFAILVLTGAMLLPQAAHAERLKLLVGGFQDVVVEGDMQVIITTGKGSSGFATGDRRILELLKLDRVSDVLTIRVQQPPNNENNVRIKEPLVVNLTNRSIRNVTLRGNAKLAISSLENNGLSRINMDGGGSVDIGAVQVDRLSVALFGTGRLNMSDGEIRDTNVRIQGSPQYNAAGVKTRKLSLDQDGNATVNAQVEEGATISNIGAGNINITGNAECFIRKAGSAIIKCPQDKKIR